jgi:hypothetical protein
LAEIRKYLDQEKVQESKYAAVRFYANWCVHFAVNESRAFTKEVAPKIVEYIHNYFSGNQQISKGDYLANFLSLEHLKLGLETFLKDRRLSAEITAGANWDAFREKLFGILSEQSFTDPIHGSFTLVYEAGGNGRLEIGALTGNPSDIIYFSKNDICCLKSF